MGQPPEGAIVIVSEKCRGGKKQPESLPRYSQISSFSVCSCAFKKPEKLLMCCTELGISQRRLALAAVPFEERVFLFLANSNSQKTKSPFQDFPCLVEKAAYLKKPVWEITSRFSLPTQC